MISTAIGVAKTLFQQLKYTVYIIYDMYMQFGMKIWCFENNEWYPVNEMQLTSANQMQLTSDPTVKSKATLFAFWFGGRGC